MLERIWIHLQTYTIVALVNSPALLMLWTGFHPVDIIDHGPQSTAVQEAPIEIYSVHIHPEDTKPIEEYPKTEEPQIKEQTIVKNPLPVRKKTKMEKSASIEKTSVVPHQTPKIKSEISPKVPFTKPSKQFTKQARKKKRKKRTAKCSPRPNRRIQQMSTNQFALQKKVVHRYLGNIDNIKGLAKAYWYSGKKGEGILLRSIPCKSPLRNMGIRPNDIIISINGKKVKNNLALVGHYFEIRSKKNVDIILKRQNRPLTLQYEIVKKLKKG